MRELCLACAGFALEFIVFYATGIVLVRILKVKGDCSLTFILGYLVYFAVFELVIVPMTLKWVSLTAAAYIEKSLCDDYPCRCRSIAASTVVSS